MLKAFFVSFFIFCSYSISLANEPQYDNEYYSYEQCIINTKMVITLETKQCLMSGTDSKNCMLTSKEIQNIIMVNCGIDDKPRKQKKRGNMMTHNEGEKCVECGKNVTVEESFLYDGKVHCEDCFRKKVPTD